MANTPSTFLDEFKDKFNYLKAAGKAESLAVSQCWHSVEEKYVPVVCAVVQERDSFTLYPLARMLSDAEIDLLHSPVSSEHSDGDALVQEAGNDE